MKNRMIYQMKNKVRNLTYFLLLIGGTALTQSCSYLELLPSYSVQRLWPLEDCTGTSECQ